MDRRQIVLVVQQVLVLQVVLNVADVYDRKITSQVLANPTVTLENFSLCGCKVVCAVQHNCTGVSYDTRTDQCTLTNATADEVLTRTAIDGEVYYKQAPTAMADDPKAAT
ncbi:hypothetical protein FHG87_013691 [Trinorchestia longiramus]|nr:hypothetical protein FHG87_013691 [Trinorchestia longiramus]